MLLLSDTLNDNVSTLKHKQPMSLREIRFSCKMEDKKARLKNDY